MHLLQNCLPLSVLKISRLNKCLILEIKISGKFVILSTVYRSLCQPIDEIDEIDDILSKFKDNLFSIIPKKSFLTYHLGNFSAKSLRRCVNDESSPEGFQIESLTSYYGLTQVLNEPTDLLSNS